MSKKNKKQEDVKLEVISNISGEAKEIFIQPLSQKIKLQNLNKVLLLSYFKDQFQNQSVKINDVLQLSLYGNKEQFQIINILPQQEDLLLVTKRTIINLGLFYYNKVQENKTLEQEIQNLNINNEIIILQGVDKQVRLISDIIKLSLGKNEIFCKSGLQKIKGILISGPAGVGKTQILKFLQNTMNDLKFIKISTIDIVSKFVGESENKINQIFEQAKQMQPCIILLDDIDCICNKKILGSQNSSGIINQLINEIDQIKQDDKIFILSTSGQVQQIDTQILRTGRIEKIIKLEYPTQQDRLSIFNTYLQKLDHSLNQEEIIEINNNMNGFSPADIISLIRESLVQTIIDGEDNIKKLTIQSILQEMQPSGLKDLILQIPKVLWSDIGGNQNIKKEIQQVIEWPLKHPEAFERMGIQPSKGILLYGPPGCSKTMTAKAIATESSLNFIAIKGPELFSKYVGDSEKAIRDLFRRARLCSPCIIFFDEIDAIATQRSVNTDVSERVLCQLLTEMDGVESLKNVIIVAATNRPDIIDKALTRPGRFDHLIYVPPPDFDSRIQIFQINMKNMPYDKNIEIENLSSWTDGYSGAEIQLICREAGLSALSRDINSEIILLKDFQNAIKKVKPRISKDLLDYYKEFQDNQKQL